MNSIHHNRAHDLFHMVYGVAPNQRLGAMKGILDCIPHDAGLRRILSDPTFLKEPPRHNGRKNIANAASAYTQKFFGVSITTYIKQVKAGTVNEELEPIRSPRMELTTDEPEIHIERDPSAFFAAVRLLRDEGSTLCLAA